MIIILSYLNFDISKSLPYPSRKPQPNELIIVLISALASTLSILAFSTLSILPLIGSIAWVLLFLAVLAEPPAESPSTMNTSHSDASLLSQLASFPLESIENLGLLRRLVLAFSSAFLILADFSAHAITAFNCSRFLSKYIWTSSLVTALTTVPASGLSSFVFVCPSNLGSGCFTATIAVIPFLTSSPVKLASLSFNMPSSLAYWLITIVNFDLKPVMCVPPSCVYMLLQNPRIFSSNSLTYWNAHSTSIPSSLFLKYIMSVTVSLPLLSSFT